MGAVQAGFPSREEAGLVDKYDIIDLVYPPPPLKSCPPTPPTTRVLDGQGRSAAQVLALLLHCDY